jgi:phosphoribosylglycinamide formyltransferase-1
VKIGILISGRGSNMVAIVDAVQSGEIPSSDVAVVISDKPDAVGLAKARERGIETLVIERRGRTRAEHDAKISDELKKRGVELVCLAGYMRLLSPSFVAAFPNRILNIHPSLLPKFPGLNIHERVLAAGETVSGCTVHFVNEDLDAERSFFKRKFPCCRTIRPKHSRQGSSNESTYFTFNRSGKWLSLNEHREIRMCLLIFVRVSYTAPLHSVKRLQGYSEGNSSCCGYATVHR